MPAAYVQGAAPLRDSFHEQVFPWEVMHACDSAPDVLGLVEGQLSIGMRPQIVTPKGIVRPHDLLAVSNDNDSPHSASLLTAWNDVRTWRKLVGEAEFMRSTEVVHAHTFAAGMAAVRAGVCPVYHLTAFIDQLAAAPGQNDDKSWLARSFRVAEQFILTRAGAVVVHTPAMRAEAVRRGAAENATFVVPDPMDESWFSEARRDTNSPLILVPLVTTTHLRDVCLAFAKLRQHIPDATLAVVADTVVASELHAAPHEYALDDAVQVHAQSDLRNLLVAADVIVLDAGGNGDMRPNATLLRAMAAGSAILATDSPPNRNVSSDGEGVLWFSPEPSPDELARRLLELLSDPGLRRRLGSEARAFIERTRTPAAVARQYDEIYRMVVRKRRERNVPPMASIPLQPAFGKL